MTNGETQMQVHQTEIVEHSGLKYRIQMRNNQGVWQQRHIWYPAPATYVSEETADEWIKSPTGLNHTFSEVKS